MRDCVRCYTAPWLVVQRRYREFGTGSLARPAAGRLGSLTAAPRQEFEVDVEAPDPPTVTDDADSGHAMQESTSKVSFYFIPLSGVFTPVTALFIDAVK